MKRKSSLLPVLTLMFILTSIKGVVAQRQTKFFKANLLTNQRDDRKDRRTIKKPNSESKRDPFRSIDGTNNNLGRGNQDWGSANTLYYRELPAVYGSGDSNNGLNGADRPSPRAISNLVIAEPVTQFTERNINTIWYSWGQFIDHDMTLTPGGTESVPILIPEDEVIFTEDIPFVRSDFRLKNSKREQINMNSAFIDGSVVYGSNSQRALWLRTLIDGKLKTSSGDLLPFNTMDGEFEGDIDPIAPMMDNDGGGTIKTFAAGDSRAAENPVLTALQTLFLREHNGICDRLLREGQTDDEVIYQLARKEVGAIIQAITYQHFLPAFGIDLKRYDGYKHRVMPNIMNTFATASYRIGHTTISDDVVIVNNDCEEVGPGEFDLIETFFNPELVVEYGIDVFLKGATVHDLYQTDTKINDVLRNFLFGDASSPVRFGIDLGSINIQRGRDHGMPDYNTVRKYYTGSAAQDFPDISSNDTVVNNLGTLYKNVNDIDLWVGILSEDHLPKKSVGKTMHDMLKKQFEKLRDGDFYFYLNDPYINRSVLRRIQRTNLADVIERNTTLTNMPSNIFLTDHCLEEEGEVIEVIVEDSTISNEGVYPNPFNESLNVKLSISEQTSKTKIYLYSLDGELMETFHTQNRKSAPAEVHINTASLKSGIYIVKIVTAGKETRALKVIKS